MFERGDKVMTPQGVGIVAYKRMAPPHYSSPQAYSVVLESRKKEPNYNGTLFEASVVEYKDGDK